MRLKNLIPDVIIYANLWIALCAGLLCYQTIYLINPAFELYDYACFIFFSTIIIYALHRIVGVLKLDIQYAKGRFKTIEQLKKPILLTAFIAIGFATYYYFKLDDQTQKLIIPAIIISLAYVLPVFGKAQRLRDFSYIKIFLIALTWCYICVAIPMLSFEAPSIFYFLILEKLLFIFAITIPFDIRDLEIDKKQGIQTIPGKLGLPKSKLFAIILILGAVALSGYLYINQTYSLFAWIGVLISYLFSFILIRRSDLDKSDYFYGGLMDGMIALQSILVIGLSYISLL